FWACGTDPGPTSTFDPEPREPRPRKPNNLLRPTRLAFGGRHFTGLHALLESAQILTDRLFRRSAEHHGEPFAGQSRRRDVIERDVQLGAAPAGRFKEADGTGVVYLRSFDRPPRQ